MALAIGLALVVAGGPIRALLAADDPGAARKARAAARHLLLTGKYAEAIERYQPLAEHDPAAAVGLSRCYAAQGQTAKTIETLVAAQKRHPKAAAVAAELAWLRFQQGDYQAADRQAHATMQAEQDNLLAHWVAAEVLRVTGRLEEARAAYKWFVDYYNAHEVEDPEQLRWIGLASAQYARWKRLSDQFGFLVNELYPDALAADADFWPAHYEAGLLYLEKYNQAEATREFKAALQINPSAAEVYAALAQLALQNYELDGARKAIERAREINPHLLEALWCLADAHLANFETPEAITVLNEARELNPVAEATLGRLAGAYAVIDGWPAKEAGSRFQKLLDSVLTSEPQKAAPAHTSPRRGGEFLLALANTFELTRKYPPAAHYFRQALERMPELIEPRGALGMICMRLGDEVQARKLLSEAFEIDPFNVRVSNSLKVLDVLDHYAVLETPHFVVRFDRLKDEILAKYVARYLEDEVYPALTRQFDFRPEGKSLFEIFQRSGNTSGHGWFSARMVGLPYIGTVGACAGKMVALASPNDMEQKYNWARVVKHEFVHVLNLQQTQFNIPHWYTEALAVESEGLPRSDAWNRMLAERVPKGHMFNLETINLGFVRPKTGEDWQMAYCQAQLYAQYMRKTYGDDASSKMLAAYADNLDTRSALKRCFGVKQEDFEQGYLDYVKGIVKKLRAESPHEEPSLAELERKHRAAPDDADVSAELALARLERNDYRAAGQLAAGVLKQHPRQALAAYVMARLRMLIGEDAEAEQLLQRVLDRKAPNTRVLQLLASLRINAEQYEQAAELYTLGTRLYPDDRQWTKGLARVYLKSGDTRRLAKPLAAIAQADGDDLVIRKKLAQLSADARDYPAARRWAIEALHVDVMDVEVHRLLAQAEAALEHYPAAIAEYEVALKLKPKDSALRFALADACLQAGQTDRAKRALQALLAADADYPGAQLLLESLEETPAAPQKK
ncbi:MAG TPA: tetratricopeptide repeat protein [Pirellulales bacterium]